MTILLIAAIALSVQGTPDKDVMTRLVGKWISTVVPRPGEAPTVAPTFSVEQKENGILVTIQGAPETYRATTFRAASDGPVLLIKPHPAQRASRTIIIRPISADEVRFEILMEYAEGGGRNFSYTEVFKRAK